MISLKQRSSKSSVDELDSGWTVQSKILMNLNIESHEIAK